MEYQGRQGETAAMAPPGQRVLQEVSCMGTFSIAVHNNWDILVVSTEVLHID